MEPNPSLILLFSGKRKSGKDYVTDLLIERLGYNKTVIIKISAPIKSYWAECKGLSLQELLSSGSLKEQFRHQMIDWSEKIRSTDHGVFCRQAIELYKAHEIPIWIVSDIRRKTDITWFKSNYPDKIKTVRVSASEDSRRDRGWIFTPGIDDAPTECDLDDVSSWDYVLNNDEKDGGHLEKFFDAIQELVN